MNRALLGLGVCAVMTFAFLTSEMLPVGLLTHIAPSLHATLPETGALLTAYALVVTFAGPPMTALTGGVPRKRLLLALVGTLAVTTALAAVAQTYAELLGARIVNALAHGIFWSIIASSAASLLPPERRGFAVALAYTGGSAGIVLGVPLGTLVGERFGWHAAFACVAATAALGFVALAALPSMPPAATSSLADVRALLSDRRFRGLLLATTLVISGYFTTFTYFAPLLERDGAAAAGGIPLLLLVFGAAGLASNFVFGPFANRHPNGAVALSAGIMAAAFVALALDLGGTAYPPVLLLPLVAVWGTGSSGVVIAFQTRILSAQPGKPDVASALNSSAFNVGIGAGAFLGGLVLRGPGLAALPAVGAALVAVGLLLQAIPGGSRRPHVAAMP